MGRTESTLNTPHSHSHAESGETGLLLKRLLQISVVLLIQAAILFISPGHLDWVMAWAYTGFYVGCVAINALIILRHDLGLVAERAEIKEGAKEWDRWLALLVGLYAPEVTLLVAGLDVRLGWSPQPAAAVQLVALAIMALGYGPLS